MTTMTLNEISRKLIKNEKKQYALFFFSILFAVSMVGAYGVLQYSPTVTNVLIDGGSTQSISQGMFFGSMLGIVVFLIYANSLFLKHKSREIGIFLSLGIDRRSVQKIITKEFTILFQIAALLGLLLCVPLAYLSWSLLNVFLETQETAFAIGWSGLVIALIFAVCSWLILRKVNRRYIKTVDILKILKSSDENDEARNGNPLLLLLGGVMVPGGIIAFFTLENMGGLLYTLLAYIGMAVAVWGVYIFIVQLASIGDVFKKYNVALYYKNIVFYNLLKQKIRQYTLSIFVATLLIFFTIFGIGFIAAGFIDGYNIAINEPYDYTINTSADNPGMTEQRIQALADESGTVITEMARMDCLLLGVENVYRDGSTDWSTRMIVSEENFNRVSGMNISVAKGTYSLYYDGTMEYKLNAFRSDESLFFNPTTKEEFRLSKNTPICADGLFNSRSFLSSFLIFDTEEYNDLSASLGETYKVTSYLLNVENWENTSEFQEKVLAAVIADNSGNIFTNWHNCATFEKTGGQAEYLPYQGNETRVARVWALYPISKISSAATQFEAFATYLMLLLFIALVAFVSSIMVVGLKLVSTIWDDAAVYENVQKLGMKKREIKDLITRQMVFIYFIPTVLGCLIGAFTTYRIMLVSGVIYIAETMQLVGYVCGLVVILQLIIFFVLRSRILKKLV